MATVTATKVNDPNRHIMRAKWLAIPNGDQGSAVRTYKFQDQSVQVLGTFGTGGSVTMQGSNDGGTTWTTLTDPQGNAVTFTAAGMKQIIAWPPS